MSDTDNFDIPVFKTLEQPQNKELSPRQKLQQQKAEGKARLDAMRADKARTHLLPLPTEPVRGLRQLDESEQVDDSATGKRKRPQPVIPEVPKHAVAHRMRNRSAPSRATPLEVSMSSRKYLACTKCPCTIFVILVDEQDPSVMDIYCSQCRSKVE